MRAQVWVPWRWPAWVWLGGLSLIFLVRFPIHFLLYPPYLMDFEVYRAVAARVAHGGAAHLYEATTSEAMLFKYAPIWALLWLPLAWMPSQTGALVWSALTTGWLVLACWGVQQLCQRATWSASGKPGAPRRRPSTSLASCRARHSVRGGTTPRHVRGDIPSEGPPAKAGARVEGLNARPWAPALAIGLLVRPVTAEFLNGQVDILWGLLVIGFLLGRLAHRPWWAACSLAMAIALKLPALLVLAYLFARRHTTMAARVCAVLLLTNVVACLALHPANPLGLLVDWGRVLWSSGTARAFEIGNQSLLALAGRFLSADPYQLNLAALSPLGVSLVTLLVSVTLFGLVSFAAPSPRLDAHARFIYDGSLLSILMVLCSPTTWIATYSALILPMTLAIAAFSLTHGSLPARAIVIALSLAIGSLSVMTHSALWRALGIRHLHGESYVFLVLMALPWLGLALFGLLWCQRQSRDRAASRMPG